MNFRVQLQVAEALGEKNRWYCSQHYGREIVDEDLLMEYYIRRGGADDFRARYSQAMGRENRWFCSEFYGRDIRDEEVLWDYYIQYAHHKTVGKDRRAEVEMSLRY